MARSHVDAARLLADYEYFTTLGKTQAMSHGEGEAAADASEGGAMDSDVKGEALTVADSAGSNPAFVPVLVVPGRVVYLEGRDGMMRATVTTAAFQPKSSDCTFQQRYQGRLPPRPHRP